MEPGKQQREQQIEHEALGVYEQLVTEVPDAGERRQAVIEGGGAVPPARLETRRLRRMGPASKEDQVAFIPPTKWEGEIVARFAFLHPDTSLKLVREVLARTE